METEKLISTNSGEDSKSGRRPSVWLLGVMWILGTFTSSSIYLRDCSRTPVIRGISETKRLIISSSTAIVPVTMTVTSSLSAVVYLICFFGRRDHFLRSLAFFCYGFSMLTPQIICTIAWLMNLRRSECDTRIEHIRWVRVFDGASFLKSFRYQKYYRPKLGMFLVFFLLALPVAVAKVVSFNELEKTCRDWMEYTWMIGDIFNVTFFASFCYYLYLRRINLEAKAIATSEYICKNVGNLDKCIRESRELFREYQELRTLVLPWLRTALFSASFGLTVFITWNYDDAAGNATTTAPPPDNHVGVQSICTDTCNQESYMKQSRMFVPYNVLEFSRYMMIATSAVIVVRGLDVRDVWEQFKTRLFFTYSAEDRKFWKYLISFVEKMHPNNTADTIFSFLIPLLGLASGILEGKRF